ncbi:hypothetical protein ABW21_db0204487 [Orbilia brochopaga]|nr:hypothetical protein ABW21_db0204487 [Drechslerella brochopaga]
MPRRLLSLPNEILLEIISRLIPDFGDKSKFANRKNWRRSEHIKVLHSLSLTCKHLSTLVRPELYSVVVLDYPTCMVLFLRTLVEKPEVRDLVRTMAICCSLQYCDEIADSFSPRQIFLDDNPHLNLGMAWDTDAMDDYAATVFKTAGLVREEYQRFTEYETLALNDDSYWFSVTESSDRMDYESELMQGLALALMALSPRLELLCMSKYAGGPVYHFQKIVAQLLECESTKDIILANLSRLEVKKEIPRYARPWEMDHDYFNALLRIPAVKKLVNEGEKTETEVEEIWQKV